MENRQKGEMPSTRPADRPMIDFIREICDRFGPRLPGTAAEAKAGRFIADELQQFCDEVDIEEHRFSPRSLDWSATIYLVGYVGGLVAYFFLPLLSAILIASLILVILLSRFKGYEILDKLFPHETTRNIVGKVKAKGIPKRIMIFSGHHDSAYYMPVFEKRYQRIFVAALLFVLGCFPILFLANIARLFSAWLGLRWLMPVSLVLFGISALGGVAAVVIRFFLFRNIAVMGANDNLAGVAVAVQAAKYFAANRPERTEVWAVSFGAEEAGLRGSKRFAERHRVALSNAILVNLEMVGAGAMVVVAAERSAGTRHSPEVVSLIVGSAKRCGITMPTMAAPLGETDASSFTRLGLKASTIATLDNDGAPPKWHVIGDTLDNMDEEHLRDALKVSLECVHTLEESA